MIGARMVLAIPVFMVCFFLYGVGAVLVDISKPILDFCMDWTGVFVDES